MSTFFSSAFIDALTLGDTTSMTGITVRMYVFPTAPLFEDNDDRYTGISTISALSSTIGWGQYISQLAPNLAAIIISPSADSHFLIVSSPFDLPVDFPATKPAALAFVYQTGPDATMVGKLMYTTNSLFLGDEALFLYNQDSIIPAPDPDLGDDTNNWLMSWEVHDSGPITVTPGDPVVIKGIPPFEPARTQHVWMYPQRINMIANPSFENGSTHWKVNGSLTTRVGGINSAHYGRALGPNSPGYFIFPGTDDNYLSAGVEDIGTGNNICVVAHIAADDYTPAAAGSIVAKHAPVSGSRSWMFQLNTTGTLGFTWSADGLTNTGSASSSPATVPAADGGWIWVGFTFDVDNGAGNRVLRFWTSTDGATWTPLGVPQIAAGTTNLFPNVSVPVTVGAQADGTTQNFTGKIGHVSVRRGFGTGGTIGGGVIFRIDPVIDLPPTLYVGVGAFPASSGQTVNVNRSAGPPKTTIVPTEYVGVAVMESNTFPTRIRKGMDEGWTIQLQARGDGELKIGLVSWPSSYEQTIVDWGPVVEKWTLTSSWISIRTLRKLFDVSNACLRLETNGSFLDIDRICVEPGFHPSNGDDWPYFDGDSRYGALDDFSWYGNVDRPTGTPTREHKTYSCWYNHRRVVVGRLFQLADPDTTTGPGSVFTDEEVAAMGMVYSWVPAGTPVRQHLDVIYANDPQSEILDVTGPTTPLMVSGTDTMGLADPWVDGTIWGDTSVNKMVSDNVDLTLE